MSDLYDYGADPGLVGAIALLRNGYPIDILDIPIMADHKSTGVVKNCVNGVRIYNWICNHLEFHGITNVNCAIEQVHAMPKQGVSSAFGFGASYGAIRTAIACAKVPIQLVTPQAWKKYFKISSDKEVARALAINMFPDMEHLLCRKKDKDRAEALLIARWSYETR